VLAHRIAAARGVAVLRRSLRIFEFPVDVPLAYSIGHDDATRSVRRAKGMMMQVHVKSCAAAVLLAGVAMPTALAVDRGSQVSLTGVVHNAGACPVLVTARGAAYALRGGNYAENATVTVSGRAQPLRREECGARLLLEIGPGAAPPAALAVASGSRAAALATYRGTVDHPSTACWLLHSDIGKTFELQFGKREAPQPGARVLVRARVRPVTKPRCGTGSGLVVERLDSAGARPDAPLASIESAVVAP
jgi:hypothetical protein